MQADQHVEGETWNEVGNVGDTKKYLGQISSKIQNSYQHSYKWTVVHKIILKITMYRNMAVKILSNLMCVCNHNVSAHNWKALC